jgi:PAS domain S-box-containing protein
LSFRLKTILGIAIIESVLLLILVLSSLEFLRTSNEQQLIQRASTTSKLFASATKDAVLATDLATLESFVEEILTNPEVVYVRILNNELLLAQAGQAEFLNQSRLLDTELDAIDDGVFDVQAEISEAGVTYGRIELGLSTHAIHGVFSDARQWATGIAVLEVILVAIFSFILGSYLTRHLRQLRNASKTITLLGPGHQLKVTGSDEISEVARAFNTMSTSLKRSYSELRESLENQDSILQKLERNRLKHMAILTASLDAIITINQEGKVVDFNQVAEQIFGWRFDEIEGRTMSEYLIPEHLREAHEQGMKHYLATGEGPVLGNRIQLQALHKDGHIFPLEAAICPIDTPEGPLFSAFLRDITKHLADQTEMRLAAKAFETSEAMFITDAEAHIIRVNQAFSRISGYQEHEVLGQRPSLWASGLHDQNFYIKMWRSLLETGEWKGEINNRRKDGEIFPEYLSISAVYDEQQSITHYVAHLVDISDQKAKQEQLRRASEQAQKADEAKSRFLAVMSHEIRTPMNAVLGILKLLRTAPLDQQQQELIKTGCESGELLLSIINDILDFSKMEAEKLELEISAFDLHQLLSQSMELFRSKAKQKRIGLILQLDDKLPRYARGDPYRLRQILVNLLNNAVKFTDQGNITIRTHSKVAAQGEFQLHCEVEDSGIGIPAEQQKALFQEFSMADQSHSRKYGGTGLGLAICKRLVSLMDGEITLESQPGRGSCFSFHIPLESADETAVEQPIEQASLPPPNPDTRILLAEDNPANQQVIQAMLQSAGLQVDIVSNGVQAVERVNRQTYDMLLMDISMPQMDGMAATQSIRKLGGAVSKIPIVAITAHALAGDKARFLSSGMNDYLTKPIDKHALLDCISRWTGVISNPELSGENRTGPEKNQSDQKQQTFVDEAVLQQLVKDTHAEIVPGLLLGYIEDARIRIDEIEQAVLDEDAKTLEFEAHTLGSSAAAHGNPILHQQARTIETMCREGKSRLAFATATKLFEIANKSLQQLQLRAENGFKPKES